VPRLEILNKDNGHLRWDASSLILSTTIVPDDVVLRSEYAAALRLQTTEGRPEARLTKRDRVLAGQFERRARIKQIMQTRRIHSILAGAVLWDLHTAAASHPDLTSKSKVEFAIDRLSIAANKMGSGATLRSAWRCFRPVLHWCAALAYQSRAFGSVFPQHPETGYVGEVVISDFLSLGDAFLAFAREYVEFPSGRPAFWITSRRPSIERRQPGWPDANVLREGCELSPELINAVSTYVVERDRLKRDWLISGPARRFDLAHGPKKQSQ
jgi:hypothetical protein